MKRLISTLAVASMAAFAMPALAAPTLIEKRQIAVPKMDAAILKQASAVEISYSYEDFERNYYTKKGKNLPVTAKLYRDIDCLGTNYRTWTVSLDIPTLSKRIGYLVLQNGSQITVLEARRNGSSKWKVFDTKTGYMSGNIFCANGSDGVVIASKNYTSYVGIPVSYETFTQDAIWKNPKYPDIPRSYGQVIIDGVWQFSGYLSVYGPSTSGQKGYVYGDSRVFVPSGSSAGVHKLPWYRDLNNANLKPGESINVTFYRLSDGYGLIESFRPAADCSVSPCVYPATITTYYRIHDGESNYSIVAGLPTPSQANNQTVTAYYNYGIELNSYGILDGNPLDNYRVTLHGLPESVSKNYNVLALNRGNVAWENAKQLVVRYFVAASAKNIQYWEAVIQK